MMSRKKEWTGLILKSFSRPIIFVCFSVLLSIIVPAGILNIPEIADGFLRVTIRVLLSAGIGWLIYSMVDILDHALQKAAAKTVSKVDDMLVPLIGKTIRITVLVVIILLVVEQISQEDIKSILAGLGIGGIALALAAQDTLKNFFGSLVIIADKPFEIGDFIVVGSNNGIVKKIGIKTTRIQTLQGEELIISNKELTESRIQNFGRMRERRIQFNFGVCYETPLEKLKKIPEIVKEIITNIEKTRLDRVHFKEFGDSALIFEVVYYVLSPDYSEYMDIQQKINFALKESFEKEKIEFAYPTQTIYLAKTNQ